MRKRKRKCKAGWRVKGSRVYHVKGKRLSRRKTYGSKKAALKSYRGK